MSTVRLYPTIPSALRRTLALDLAVLLGILAFGWAGMKVHDGVAELAGLGRGLQDAGSAVQDSGRTVGGALRDGFGGAAGAVGGAPVIGGTLEDALRSAGDDAGGTVEQAGSDSGGRVAAAGRDGERKAYRLANLLGWLTFGLPTLLLLARVGPGRVRGVLGWTAATRVFGAGAGSGAGAAVAEPARGRDGTADRGERRRVLAARAMSTLPYRDLLRHTADPVGDLLAGRHDGLLAALAEADGVDSRRALAPA